jgi:hypothetical protein
MLISEQLLTEILDGLEREYSNTRKSWTICVCLNLILCMIAGELQIYFDGRVIYKTSKEGGGEDPVLATKAATDCYQRLEEVLTEYSWFMFFGLFKKYNPIKDGCPMDDGSGQNEGEAGLVDSCRKIVTDFGNSYPLVAHLQGS